MRDDADADVILDDARDVDRREDDDAARARDADEATPRQNDERSRSLDASARVDAGARTSTDAMPSSGAARASGRGKYLPELSIRAYARAAEKVGETIEIDDVGDDSSDGERAGKRRRRPVEIKFEKDVRKFTVRMIGGCEVKFPEGLSPHPAQMMTMSSIIRTLTKGEHAMIESPTGTGKTLAILCGALAWQEKYGVQTAAANVSVAEEREKYEKARIQYLMKKCDSGEENPTVVRGDGWSAADSYFKGEETARSKIFICSRTHSQLNQILRELKRTGYSPRYTVLSSRQRMCQLNKNDAECKQLIGSAEDKKKTGSTDCPYYNRHRYIVSTMSKYATAGRAGKFPQAWDMEDFERVVDEVEGCSFFALREMYNDADIVFCPYNYLFDVNIRRKMSIDTENACVIIDEGHNLEDVCREGSSMEISLEAIGQAADQLAKNHGVINAETDTIAQFFTSVSGFFENIFRMNSVKEDVVKSNQVQDFIEGMLIGCSYELQEIVEMVDNLMTTKSKFMTPLIAPHVSLAGDLAQILIFAKKNAPAYNIIFGTNVDVNGENCPGAIIQCMKPSIAFNEIATRARSVILTSGTLSPMTTFEAELGVKFMSKIEAPHVVPNENVYVEVTGAMGEITYKATEGDVQGTRFAQKLGEYLLRYAKIIPGGMLVFFPKYSLIDRTIREWHVSGLYGRLSDHKEVCYETRGSRGFQETLNQFDRGNERGRGSLMLAVYRGKVSEGIDFKDDKARAVFCIGIPFPSMFDIKVKAKKEFNDSPISKSQGMLSGGEWYRAQAYRAYNQALGRCIRHPKDYAALFLVDSRFREGGTWMLNNVSKWIRNNTRACDDVNQSVQNVKAFFKRLRNSEIAEKKMMEIQSASGDRLSSEGPPPDAPPASDHQKENFLFALGCESNRALVDDLDAMRQASERAGEDPMRVNAYAKALTSIRELKYEVTSGLKLSKGPTKVPHVGPSIGTQIDYWLEHRAFERMAFYEKNELPPAK